MIDIESVEDALKSDEVRQAMDNLLRAEASIRYAASNAKYVAEQVVESEKKTKDARAEYAKARTALAIALANEVK